jgi:hypothetical protein
MVSIGRRAMTQVLTSALASDAVLAPALPVVACGMTALANSVRSGPATRADTAQIGWVARGHGSWIEGIQPFLSLSGCS